MTAPYVATHISKCCGGVALVWVQVAWDLDKEGHLVWFGWWFCPNCGKALGDREHLQKRYFRIPLEDKK